MQINLPSYKKNVSRMNPLLHKNDEAKWNGNGDAEPVQKYKAGRSKLFCERKICSIEFDGSCYHSPLLTNSCDDDDLIHHYR